MTTVLALLGALASVTTPAASAELLTTHSPRGGLYAYLTEARRPDYGAAATHLDLRGIPAERRVEEGPRLARQLKVILDRNIWFDVEKVSDRPEGNLEDGLPPGVELLGSIRASGAIVDIVMVRAPEGDQGLVWKFSPTLVARIPDLYEEFGAGWLGEHVPTGMQRMRYFGVEMWQWLALLVLLVLTWVLSFTITNVLARGLRRLAARTRSLMDDHLLDALYRPFRWALWTALIAASVPVLRISVRGSAWLDRLVVALAFIAAIRIVAGISQAYARSARERLEREGQRSGAGVVNFMNRIVQAVLACIAIIGLLQALGFNVTGLLAGLGIGGVAIALALQKTLENLFGGLTLMADKPVKIGDFCRFGEKSGWVEEIGFRSTRIRTLERTVLSVPNAEFSVVQIENFAERNIFRFFTTLNLRYETTPDQLRSVLTALRTILLSHPKVSRDQLRVRFSAFGRSSFDVEINAYVLTAEVAEFQAIREDLLLRVMDAVQESGTSFAFPSQTLYLTSDGGVDAGKARAAEASIQALRAQGRLPFPEFTPLEIDELTDRIEYPPEGSSSASPPIAAS